jgi:hypothetical protein
MSLFYYIKYFIENNNILTLTLHMRTDTDFIDKFHFLNNIFNVFLYNIINHIILIV